MTVMLVSLNNFWFISVQITTKQNPKNVVAEGSFVLNLVH